MIIYILSYFNDILQSDLDSSNSNNDIIKIDNAVLIYGYRRG